MTLQHILPLFGIDPSEPVKPIHKSAWDIGGQYILKKGANANELEKSMLLSGLLPAKGIPVPEYYAATPAPSARSTKCCPGK